jgi:hypothetical protein
VDPNIRQIFVGRLRAGLPAWAVTTIALFRDRIVRDLLRAEHGIMPAPERQTLKGGAVLHRLPAGRHPPEFDPPIRPPSTGSAHRGPGAA